VEKVILVNPYYEESDHIQPPIGLGYLASCLKKNGFEPVIIDANKERLKESRLVRKIINLKPNFVGIQVYSVNLKNTKDILNSLKKKLPRLTTFIGGPHPSSSSENVFDYFKKSLDFAFKGEAEIGLPQLLSELKNDPPDFKKIPGLIYKDGEKTISNRPLFEANLDQFGMPDWNLIKPETYPEAQHGAFFKNFPIAPIVTTRGCPFNCAFCAGKLNNGSVFRKRGVGGIVEEIKELYYKHGIREFHIVDDNFTLDKAFAKSVLKEIIRLNLKASFAVPNGVRLDTLDEEILSLMKRAGFYLVSVGIESGSDRVLKLMNKNLMPSQIREKVHLIKKSGLDVAGFFILGYPGETEKEIKKTIKFSLELGLLRANYFIFLPLPGTPVFKELERDGKLKKMDFSNFSFTEPSFEGNINSKKLAKLQKEAFVKFYFRRPKILIKNLTKIKSPKHAYFLFKRALHWLS
jgi:radical SAM superfamily enzyme YgiQ (UPF0313 family)